MQHFKRILFAVKNPDARSQRGADKAIRIAKSLGASLEFFNAISSPVFMQLAPIEGNSLADIKRESLALRKKRLEKLVVRARAAGVDASAAVEWDFPPHEAIVRRAHACHADLIVAEGHAGKRLLPWLLHLTDWELLRTSQVPVLLLKNAKPWRRPRILAAVDPSHAHAKPSALDDAILGDAQALSRTLRGSFHLMHANFPSVIGLTVGDPTIDAMTLAATYEAQKQEAKKTFEDFADSHKIPRARRHLVDFDPVYGIPHTAKKLRANLVVMGAVSRSGLKRVFIGNTAERILSDLPCDVLVVKPGRFPKKVADQRRGMRVFAAAPLAPMPA